MLRHKITSILTATVLVASIFALFISPMEEASAHAGKDILIYGPSLHTGAKTAGNAQTLAVAAGHTVVVDTDATWQARSTASFASFEAIVFDDPNCQIGGNANLILAGLNTNKATFHQQNQILAAIYILS